MSVQDAAPSQGGQSTQSSTFTTIDVAGLATVGSLNVAALATVGNLMVYQASLDSVAHLQSGVNQWSYGVVSSTGNFVLAAGADLSSDSHPPIQCTLLGSIALGSGSLSAGSTDGHMFIPSLAGAPSGIPAPMSGHVAVLYDTNVNRLRIFNGAAWRSALFS